MAHRQREKKKSTAVATTSAAASNFPISHIFFFSVHRIHFHSRDGTLNRCCVSKAMLFTSLRLVRFTVASREQKKKEKQRAARVLLSCLFLFLRVKVSLLTAMLIFGDGGLESSRFFAMRLNTKSPTRVYQACKTNVRGAFSRATVKRRKSFHPDSTVSHSREGGEADDFLSKTSCGQLPSLLPIFSHGSEG